MALSRPKAAFREYLFHRSKGVCERGCGAAITLQTMHVAHLRASSHGGPLIEENLQAWCPTCNLTNGARDVADGRVSARQWQIDKLEAIVQRIRDTGAATQTAAPGGGKTIFAGLAFERLYETDVVDRLVVFVPRITLVNQWVDALVRGRHLELRANAAYERPGSKQVGVVNTYQSLMSPENRRYHREQIRDKRTLLVLDEVHHIGEPTNGETSPAWARYVQELAGTVDRDLHVTGVLNLSGTLWRSRNTERISTVRYINEPDGRVLSQVDGDVPAEDLIRNGELRPVDLFRVDARVEINDYAHLTIIESDIADLDAKPARAAMKDLGGKLLFREAFVGAVLDRLEAAYRSLDRYPAKALIVASSITQAKEMCQSADDLMLKRGLRPMAKVATSDDPAAAAILENFRRAEQPGVLCTVDMAGEGFDCPAIAVIGYASNKLTPLYIRQVVARAQRVTDREREQGRPIPAVVVVPDSRELVEHMVSILKPMHHEIVVMPLREPRLAVENEFGGGDEGLLGRAYKLESVRGVDARQKVQVVGELDGEVDGQMVVGLEPHLAALGLRPSDAPRMLVAARRVIEERRSGQPFDPPTPVDRLFEDLAAASRPPVAVCEPSTTRPVPAEAMAKDLLHQLTKAAGWWHQFGDSSAQQFNDDVNRAHGVGPGQRKNASVDRLNRMVLYTVGRITTYCRTKDVQPPRFELWHLRGTEED